MRFRERENYGIASTDCTLLMRRINVFENRIKLGLGEKGNIYYLFEKFSAEGDSIVIKPDESALSIIQLKTLRSIIEDKIPNYYIFDGSQEALGIWKWKLNTDYKIEQKTVA